MNVVGDNHVRWIAWAGLATLVACSSTSDERDSAIWSEDTTQTGPAESASTTASGSRGTDGGTGQGSGETGPAEGTSSATDDGFLFDLGSMLDVDGATECLPCEISLFTTASTTLAPTNDNDFLIEVFLEGDRVYALDESGSGRVAFSGDSDILYAEGDCPIWSWLGATGTEAPRVLCFGARHACTGLTDGATPLEVNKLHEYPGQLLYAGTSLPEPYDTNAAALRADYDVVVYAATNDAFNPWSSDPQDAAIVADFVETMGGGAYIVGEYSTGGMGPEQFEALQNVAAMFEVSFDQVWLDWGQASASTQLECFPTPAG